VHPAVGRRVDHRRSGEKQNRDRERLRPVIEKGKPRAGADNSLLLRQCEIASARQRGPPGAGRGPASDLGNLAAAQCFSESCHARCAARQIEPENHDPSERAAACTANRKMCSGRDRRFAAVGCEIEVIAGIAISLVSARPVASRLRARTRAKPLRSATTSPDVRLVPISPCAHIPR